MIIAIVYDHRGRTKAGQEGPVEVRNYSRAQTLLY